MNKVKYVRLLLWVIFASLVAAIAIALGAMLGGASLADGAKAVAVLAPQFLLGMSIWLVLSRHRKHTWVEIVGVGLVAGPSLFALIAFILRWLLPIDAHAISLAGLGISLFIGLSATTVNHFLFPNIAFTHPVRNWLTIGGLIFLAIVATSLTWNQIPLPLSITGWDTLGGDAAFDQAAANSLAESGLKDNLLFHGQPFRYHFLSQAWTGFSDAALNSSPYVFLTRVGPITMVAAILMCAWVWIGTLSRSTWVPFLATILMVAGGMSYSGTTLTTLSRTQLWGSALMLLVVLSYTKNLRQQIRFWPAFAIPFTGLMVLAKVNTAILIPALIVGALAIRDTTQRFRVASISVVSGVVGVLTVVGFEYGYGNGPYVNWAQTSKYLGFGAADTPLVITALALVGTVIMISMPWLAGANVLGHNNLEKRVFGPLGLCLAAMAIIFCVFLGQWGQSQVYFLVTASIVLVPLAAWGIDIYVQENIHQSAWRWLVALTGVLLGALLWILTMPDYPALGVVLVLLLSVAASSIIAASPSEVRVDWRHFRKSLTAQITASFFAGALFLNISAALQSRIGDVPDGPTEANTISLDQIVAIGRLQALNIGKQLVGTNILCDTLDSDPIHCIDIQFPVAALGSQRMLIEGSSYSSSSANSNLALEYRRLQHQFSVSPNASHQQALWNLGVRWFFIDTRRTDVRDYEPFARAEIRNPDAIVLKLNPPTDN